MPFFTAFFLGRKIRGKAAKKAQKKGEKACFFGLFSSLCSIAESLDK